MKAKIIFINPIGEETTVATFRANVEAFQAAALFQAILPPQSHCEYWVEYKASRYGPVKRTRPDTLRNHINGLTYLSEHVYRDHFPLG